MRTRPAIWTGIAALSAVLAGAVALAGEKGGTPAPHAGPLTAARTVDGPAGHLLLVATGEGTTTATIDGERVTARGLPTGILMPGTTKLLSTEGASSSTSLRITDLVSSRTSRLSEHRGELAATVVSGSGRYAALTPPRREGATAWLPDGRRNTRIVVAPVSRTDKARSFSLQGNFEPEAFSTDDRTLFLIEYMPARAPSHYAVRRLNLASGRVAPIARLKLAAPRVMRGTGRMQVLAPDRSELYTLYTQQGPNYAHGAPSSHDPDDVHAFVHVLSLRDRWAHCIDLPAPFGEGKATSSALAVTPEGDELFVTDWTQGVVATVDPSKLSVLKTANVTLGGADDKTFAAASATTLYVAGESTVVALDATTMSETARWEAPAEIEGLALVPGAGLYVAAGNRTVMLDPSLQSEIEAWTTRGVAGILGVFQTGEGS